MSTRLASILQPPYADYDAARLLDHFHTRTGLEYFPIVDPDETRSARVDAVLAGEFRFNGETHRLADPVPWLENPSPDIEWQILLHKFYFAVGLAKRYDESRDARYLKRWMSLTDSWIAATPPDFIAADVTGRRVQNWIYAHYYFVTRNRPAELCALFYARFLESLYEQVEAMRAALAPARNHRTLELYALFLAAVVFPEWRMAAAWREEAIAALTENVCADFLADGVHCELSTDYHHLALRNLLAAARLARLNGIAMPGAFEAGLVRALEFAMHVHQPAGGVPAFSDGDVHDYRGLLVEGYELFGREDMRYVATGGRHGMPPAERSRGFADAGYYVMRGGWGRARAFEREQHLVIDCGPLGAGNHGHFDCLSFELAAYGRPLIVDPGRYTYDESGPINWRAVFRGTAAHNTVLVDRRNQTRYERGAKKMKVRGAAPEPRVLAFRRGTDHDYFHGEARSAEYPVVHERALLFVAPEYWLVADYLHATDDHRYDLRFHLDAEAHGRTVLERFDGMQIVAAPNLLLVQCDERGLEMSLEDGAVARRYGEKRVAPVVQWTRNATATAFHTLMLPHAGAAPAVAMRALPVWAGTGDAFQIRIGEGVAQVTDTWFIRPHAARGACRFGSFRFDGRFAFIREDAYGEVIRAHADALLDEGGYALNAGEAPAA